MRLLSKSRRGVRVALGAACACVLAVAAAPVHASLTGNPADRTVLLSQPIDPLHYDYARHCLSHPQPGTLALQSWLEQNWPGVSWGIMRCEKLSPHNYSLHSEGRAIDWHLDAFVPAQRQAAMHLIHMLLATDQNGNEDALARRMGVQGLIFNCQDWFGYGNRLGRYSYCYGRNGKLKRHLDPTQAHRNHIHIELNWAGARKRTSFWRSPLAH